MWKLGTTKASWWADQAAVSVNFWLTPDEANLNPERGGHVVYDVAAPADWDAADYNSNAPQIWEFLKRAGAKPLTVPYRANRAVIFDSDLFHKTDDVTFKGGYLNRRINCTILFGRRTLTAARMDFSQPLLWESTKNSIPELYEL